MLSARRGTFFLVDDSNPTRFFFRRHGVTWKPCTEIGWVSPPASLHRPGDGQKGVHALDGVPSETLMEPGLYMAIEVDQRDTHGGPIAAALYFTVEKIPEKRRLTERSSAQALFGAR